MPADALENAARVLVVAPTARDARLSRALLTRAGLGCAICQDLATFGDELARGVGVVVLTEQALTPERRQLLIGPLAAQPIWSDLPIILLSGQGPAHAISAPLVRQLGNVLVLERPVSAQTLLGVVEMALRTRRRQHLAHMVSDVSLLLSDVRGGEAHLAAVARLLAPRLADCCLIYTLDAGAPRLAATAFADGAGQRLGDAPAPGAAVGGGPPDDEQALAAMTALAEAHLQLIGASERRVVPLQTPAGPLGIIGLGMRGAGRSFAPEDRQVIQALADRVALALDQARLYRTLQGARDTLELRVQERTAALAAANQVLQDEIARRERVERERAELLERVLSVQEDERRRIARDLHDQLGQQITGLLLGLKQVEQQAQGMALARLIPPLQSLTEQMAREAHRIAVALRPTALDDLGLAPALERLVTQWSEQSATPASFISVGLDGERLAPPIETAIYRVVQEALTNAGKYAAAHTISVVIQRHRDQVQAIIEDDGRGFAADAPAQDDGRPRLGLLGMQERVAQLGGDFAIDSAPGSGTTISARIPLRRRGARGQG